MRRGLIPLLGLAMAVALAVPAGAAKPDKPDRPGNPESFGRKGEVMPEVDKRAQTEERRVTDERARVRPERVAPPSERRPRRLVRWQEWMIVVLVVALGAAGIAILLGGGEEAGATPYNLATNIREAEVVVPEAAIAPSTYTPLNAFAEVEMALRDAGAFGIEQPPEPIDTGPMGIR